MPSKMSWFNKEIVVQIGRSTGWISIVYFLGLLFALPIHIMMIFSKEQPISYQKVQNLFQYNFSIQMPLLITVPVLMAIFLFRYLHVKKAADLMHSIPVKREKLYHHYALSGFVLLIVPIVIIAIVLLLTHTAMDLGPYFTKTDILYWAGMTILMNVTLYTVGLFVAMMTGMSVIHAVLTYIALFFPVGITLLIFYTFKVLFYGYPSDYYLAKQLENMSPLTYAMSLNSRHFDGTLVFLYGVLALCLYWLSLFFYKKRKLEAASEAISFIKLRSIFKYGVTFCIMLVGGVYFHEVSYTSSGWTVFGYLIGAIVGYFIAEMILQKTWRVFGRLKGLAVYLAVIALAGAVLQSLGFYENRIPKLAEVKSVILSDNASMLQDQNIFGGNFVSPLPLKEKESIAAVRNLHEQIIAHKNMNLPNQNQKDYCVVKYELKDGSTFIREYRIDKMLYDNYLKPIYGSAEYKRATKQIFQIKPNKIQAISILANSPDGRKVMVYEPQEVKQVLNLLKADILNESYEDSVYYENRGSTIELDLGRGRIVNFSFQPTYHQLAKWLQEKNMLEKARVTADDVDHIVVAKNTFGEVMDPGLIPKKVEDQTNKLSLTDKGQITDALNLAGTRSSDYIALFYYKQGKYPEIFYYDEEHAPDYVKSELE